MSKPKFDPSKPFEVVADEKPKFDPSQPFEVVEDREQEEQPVAAPKNTIGDSLGSLLKTSSETAADAVKGATQGASMGFLDEISGAVGAGLDQYAIPLLNRLGLADKSPSQHREEMIDSGLDVKPITLSDSYEGVRDEARADIKATEERSPIASTVGNVAGSIYTGLKVPAMLGKIPQVSSAVSSVASTAGNIASKIPGAATVAAKAAQYPGTTKALSTMAKFGALGAPEGFVYGVGESEGQNASDVIDDGLEGAVTGSLTGLGMGLVTDGVVPAAKGAGKWIGNKVDNLIEDSSVFRAARAARKIGKEKGVNLRSIQEKSGEGVSGPIGSSEYSGKAADDIVSKITSADEINGKRIGKTVGEATANGLKIDAASELEIIRDLATDSTTKSIFPRDNQFYDILKSPGTLNPTQLFYLRRTVDDVMSKVKNANDMKSASVKSELDHLRGAISQKLNQVPGFQDANRRFAEFRELIPESFLLNGKSEEFGTAFYGALKDRDSTLQQRIKSTIDGVSNDIMAGETAKVNYARMKRNLEALKAKGRFEELDAMGASDIDAFLKDFKAKGDLANAQYRLTRQQHTSGVIEKTKEFLAGKDLFVSGAGFMGRAERFASPLVNASKQIYKWPTQKLDSFADQLLSSPSTSANGQALKQAIMSNDTAKKNAIVFSLLQKPDTRAQIEAMSQEEDDQAE